MIKMRLLLNITITLSTAMLVGILAFDKLGNTDNKSLIKIFLQIMHISLFVGATLNIVHFIKDRKFLNVILTALPLAFFVIAVIGSIVEYRFSNLSLVIFDFYLIFWFFYLSLRECENLIKIKKG
jgi:hypothetical protein